MIYLTTFTFYLAQLIIVNISSFENFSLELYKVLCIFLINDLACFVCLKS